MTPEKLCIFCKHFRWSAERAWGMGSTQTGPMYEGGNATCKAGQFKGEWDTWPNDEAEYRAIILRAKDCPEYVQCSE